MAIVTWTDRYLWRVDGLSEADVLYSTDSPERSDPSHDLGQRPPGLGRHEGVSTVRTLQRTKPSIRNLIRAICTMMLAAALAIGLGLPATAAPAPAVPVEPPNPSDDQINTAKEQTAKAAAEVGKLNGDIAVTEGEITRLEEDLQLKGELANKAQIDLDLAEGRLTQAKADAVASAQAADKAGDEITAAEQRAAEFAAAAARNTFGSHPVFNAFHAAGPDELLDRDAVVKAVGESQRDVLNALQAARNAKANLDSAARAARDEAEKVRQETEQARQKAEAAKKAASEAYEVGQQRMAQLKDQLAAQQASYTTLLATTQSLQTQRVAHDQWLAEKKAEEERARVAAEEAKRKAQEEMRLREEQARQRAAEEQRQAELAEKQRQAEAAAAAKAKADEDAAAEAAAQNGQVHYASCDAARAAGAAPMQRGSAGYRDELDPNQNGWACDAGTEHGPKDNAPADVYYATCDAARAAGAAPLERGKPGYRAELDGNNNGWACDAGTGQEPSAPPVGGGGGDAASTVVNAALAYLGTTYAWGGGNSEGPSRGIRDHGVADRYGDYNKIGFDCSGLSLYAWAQAGVNLPHYSGYQYNVGARIPRSQLQPGDLLFWARNVNNPRTIHHVAIYLGDGKMVEAPQSGSVVKISSVYWNGYIGATRPNA